MWPFSRKPKKCRRCRQVSTRLHNIEVIEPPKVRPESVCDDCLEGALQERLSSFSGSALITQPIPRWVAYLAYDLAEMVEAWHFLEEDVAILRSLLPGGSARCGECGNDSRLWLVDSTLFKKPKNSGFDGFQQPSGGIEPRCPYCVARNLATSFSQEKDPLKQILLPRDGDCILMSWEV